MPTASGIAARFGDERVTYRLGAPGAPHRAELARRRGGARRARRRCRAWRCRRSLRIARREGPRRAPRARRAGRRHPAHRRELQRQSRLDARGAWRPWRRYRAQRFPRRIAVLGDMLELGDNAGRLHAASKEPVDAAEVDLVFACGPLHAAAVRRAAAGARGAMGGDVSGDRRGRSSAPCGPATW